MKKGNPSRQHGGAAFTKKMSKPIFMPQIEAGSPGYLLSLSLPMKKLVLSGLLVLTAAVSAQAGYIESYTARLIDRDHYNSNGERLESAAAIIRQNRANFYVYGIRTDEDDRIRFSAANRIERCWNNF